MANPTTIPPLDEETVGRQFNVSNDILQQYDDLSTNNYDNISDPGKSNDEIPESPQINYSLSDQNNTSDNDYLAAVENEDMASDENRDIRWSLKSDVEETKNLVAIHNLKPDDLINAFQLGFTPRRNQTM